MMATALAGETVDAICWRVLGRTAGVTEQVYRLNRELAHLGPELPGGTEIVLPDIVQAAPIERATVKLWD
ncbi:MAG: tail protein X [Erythrobacter sp.]|nr:tail protein X [Erythrobacter sp.]